MKKFLSSLILSSLLILNLNCAEKKIEAENHWLCIDPNPVINDAQFFEKNFKNLQLDNFNIEGIKVIPYTKYAIVTERSAENSTKLLLLDLSNGQIIDSLETEEAIFSFCLLHGDRVMVGHYNKLTVWDLKTKTLIAQKSFKDDYFGINAIIKNAFSCEISIGFNSGHVVVINDYTFEPKINFKVSAPVQALCFIGLQLAVGTGKNIHILNLNVGKEVGMYCNSDEIISLKISGTVLIAGLKNGTINFFGISPMSRLKSLETNLQVTCLDCLLGNILAISSLDGQIRYLNMSVELNGTRHFKLDGLSDINLVSFDECTVARAGS